MQAVTGAMGSLIPKLWALLKDEYNLQKGLKEQVKNLSLELESAHAALRKVAGVPPDQLDEQVRLWAREVREASYDMEDILDTYLVRIGEPTDQDTMLKRLREKMGSLLTKSKKRHKIAGAINDMKKHIKEVAERRGSYTVDTVVATPAAASSEIDPRLAAMYKEVEQLIGIDKARGELKSMLLLRDDVLSKKMKRVSVVGVGGLGKTTLAKAVYDELIKSKDYECAAFVPVGRNPDLKKVFKDILIDLDKQRYTTNFNMTILDERQLINELREFLKPNKYLIVIDDVWEIRSWETIKLALAENNHGSRIITTTRNIEVAIESGEVYRQRPLSYENSHKLFYTRIFGDDGKYPDNQQDMISDRILKKCDGIPLAIITMASLLVGKSRELWSEVYSSIGFGSKDNRHVENTMRIISFSYYDLPPPLRTCLLYLCAFPEDSFVDKNTLIWKWRAEGFVHEEQGSRSFELAERYFNDLINRSLIQAVSQRGMIQGCRVHDMVLDLLRSISCEENFVTVLGSNSDEHTLPKDNNVRRLVHQKIRFEHTCQTNRMSMPQVRSFVAYRCHYRDFVLLSTFKLLRVLVIEHCIYKEGQHFEYLGNLLHLRYLGLRGTRICELPKEVGSLKFLQVLELDGADIKELPSSVGLLTRLQCLRGDSWCTSVPDGSLAKLTSLEELEIFAGDKDESKRQFVKELGSLKKLRVLATQLHVMDDSMQRDLVASLRSMHEIQNLAIWCTATVDTAEWEAANFVLPLCLRQLILPRINFSKLPSCIKPTLLPNLSNLSLDVAAMEEQDLKTLGGLPELRHLVLLFVESTLTVGNIAGCFQKLRSCCMGSMLQFMCNEDSSVSLHIWNGKDEIPFGSEKKDVPSEGVAAPTVMPRVKELEFAVYVRALCDANSGCDNLGLEHLTSLQSVTVDVMCRGASVVEVEAAEAALRRSLDVHPNGPTLKIERYQEEFNDDSDKEEAAAGG